MVNQNSPDTSASRASLWDFALGFYASPGVEDTCLTLQDRWGADVTLVLWLVWLERRGVGVSAQEIEAAGQRIGHWQAQVTTPLRQLRRHIKANWLGADAGVQSVRESIQQAELRAEKQALEWLQVLAVRGEAPLEAGDNLRCYFKLLTLPEKESRDLLTRLIHRDESGRGQDF